MKKPEWRKRLEQDGLPVVVSDLNKALKTIDHLLDLIHRGDPAAHCATGCDYCFAISDEITEILKEHGIDHVY